MNSGIQTRNWFTDNIGGSINIGMERSTDFAYYWLIEIEKGIGYSKSFSNGKPINFFINIPENPWQLWKSSIGIDANINGWGVGFNILGENSINLHLGKGSLDLYTNTLGRAGFKWSRLNNDGTYTYYKFAFNGPEILATVAFAYFVAPYVAKGIFALLKGIGALKQIGV